MTTRSTDRTIVLNLLRGAVPERADEISRLWRSHGHEVDVAPSSVGSTMEATSKRIRFDTKTIDFFWLIGFSAWRAIEVYAPALTVATLTGATVEAALGIDDERGRFEQDFKSRIASARTLLDSAETSEIEWPDDLPQPTADRESLPTSQDQAVFDLVALALASPSFTSSSTFRRARANTHTKHPRRNVSPSPRKRWPAISGRVTS